MDDIQRSSSPKSKMGSSYWSSFKCGVLETNLTGIIFANLFNSLYLLVGFWWNILVANLATNFQNLVAKVKNVVALAPVLGAISRPDCLLLWSQEYCTVSDETGALTTSLLFESKTRKWNPYRTQRILFFYSFLFLQQLKHLSPLSCFEIPACL